MAAQKGAINDAGGVVRRRSRAQSGVDKDVDIVDICVGRNFTPVQQAAPRPLLMGIDPGFGGAICVVDLDRGDIVDMVAMPLFQKQTKERKQGYFNMLDVHKLSSLIDFYAPQTCLAVLEEPGAMPEQGLGSTFRFGHTCGQIHGVLAGHYVPVAPVKPAVWKSALALNDVKKESIVRANMEFPKYMKLWALQKHNDRAEAALLCVYARKYMAGMIKAFRR